MTPAWIVPSPLHVLPLCPTSCRRYLVKHCFTEPAYSIEILCFYHDTQR